MKFQTQDERWMKQDTHNCAELSTQTLIKQSIRLNLQYRCAASQ